VGCDGRLSTVVEQHVFDEVAQALRGLVPLDLGELQTRAHRYGIKVWFGGAKPPREHYEAQVVGAKHVPGAEVLAIEVGYHAEHPDPALNTAALSALASQEKRWRKLLGPEAEAAPFIADRNGWKRLSETWADPDLGDPELAFEVAARLTDYITAFEPIRAAATG
jgi:hypothetical protein